jgi:hypothetical protein
MLNKANTTQADLERINNAITRLEHQGVLGAIRPLRRTVIRVGACGADGGGPPATTGQTCYR